MGSWGRDDLWPLHTMANPLTPITTKPLVFILSWNIGWSASTLHTFTDLQTNYTRGGLPWPWASYGNCSTIQIFCLHDAHGSRQINGNLQSFNLQPSLELSLKKTGGFVHISHTKLVYFTIFTIQNVFSCPPIYHFTTEHILLQGISCCEWWSFSQISENYI